MAILMERLYANLDEAKAFVLSFTNFVHVYDDIAMSEFESEPCQICGKAVQVRDYLVPKANCKKPYGILSSYEFGVNQELRDELIGRFDITQEDFRPIRNKKGEIVFYQITPRHIMLPIHRENGWLPCRPCPKCGSVRYGHREFENDKGEDFYYISKEAVDEMHDLNVTYEKHEMDMPDFVISRRVYEFLVERYPRTHYFPLFLRSEDSSTDQRSPR